MAPSAGPACPPVVSESDVTMYDDARPSSVVTAFRTRTDPRAQMAEMMSALAKACCPDVEIATEDVLSASAAYSMALRGKRARGVLLLLIVDGFRGDWRAALDLARAVEMVHTASLIIDDLPCMDDAATRRGKPTNHVKYGDATAILAAIALLSDALVIVSRASALSATQASNLAPDSVIWNRAV